MLVSSYIYVPVRDLEEAAAWYEKHLDFHVVYRDALYFDIRTDSGVKAMLIPKEDHITSQMRYSTGEQAAYGFCVSDYDAVKARLEAGSVRMGEEFDYFGRSFSLYDPDGNKIEIWEDFRYTP